MGSDKRLEEEDEVGGMYGGIPEAPEGPEVPEGPVTPETPDAPETPEGPAGGGGGIGGGTTAVIPALHPKAKDMNPANPSFLLLWVRLLSKSRLI